MMSAAVARPSSGRHDLTPRVQMLEMFIRHSYSLMEMKQRSDHALRTGGPEASAPARKVLHRPGHDVCSMIIGGASRGGARVPEIEERRSHAALPVQGRVALPDAEAPRRHRQALRGFLHRGFAA